MIFCVFCPKNTLFRLISNRFFLSGKGGYPPLPLSVRRQAKKLAEKVNGKGGCPLSRIFPQLGFLNPSLTGRSIYSNVSSLGKTTPAGKVREIFNGQGCRRAAISSAFTLTNVHSNDFFSFKAPLVNKALPRDL